MDASTFQVGVSGCGAVRRRRPAGPPREIVGDSRGGAVGAYHRGDPQKRRVADLSLQTGSAVGSQHTRRGIVGGGTDVVAYGNPVAGDEGSRYHSPRVVFVTAQNAAVESRADIAAVGGIYCSVVLTRASHHRGSLLTVTEIIVIICIRYQCGGSSTLRYGNARQPVEDIA